MKQYLTEIDKIRDAIDSYSHAKILWLDTEVADYQTSKPKLSLIQVLDDSTNLNGDRVLILDVLNRPQIIDEFINKIMADAAIEKVFHNANYDRRFLGKRQAQNLTCTLEMVKKIPYYIVPLTNYKLKTLAENLCHFPIIDKKEQGGDWGQRPLTDNQLEYAKMDPVYLAQIHHRLLQLSQLIEPNPAREDIQALTRRYRQIIPRWQELDSEVEHLKARLKRCMAFQKITECNGFKLSQQKRLTKKVNLNQLAQVIHESGREFDFDIKLTQELQNQLGEILEKVPIQEETDTSLQLRISEINEEDLPF
jgi:ribonuclease D